MYTMCSARNLLLTVAILATQFAAADPGVAASPAREFYQIKIYLLKSAKQEALVDRYLQQAYLPALHRAGIFKIGVFKPIANDTASTRRIFILLPILDLATPGKLLEKLSADQQYLKDGAEYLDAPFNEPPYLRIETILLEAFPGMPHFGVPELGGEQTGRVYELRSYEGATERIHVNKVDMFNKGDEVGLFKRLGFNAVFYAEVLAGGNMPNLMYMTSFDNMASHDQHWKSFVDDPYWKSLSAMPNYQNNVSHIDITLMHPAPYSDL